MVASAGAPDSETGAPERLPAMRARILIVEDEPALLRALRINLRARSYEVVTAAAGRQALSQAAQHPPDAVILDLGLPDLDGIAVIRELRAWSRAPVIVLSGRTGSGDKIGALDAGADDYVTKPFSMEELLARLRAALRRDERGLAGTRSSLARASPTWRPAPCPQRRAGPADPHRVAAAGHPGPPPRPAGRHPAAARRRVGAGLWASTRYLRFHMARLRRKLEDGSARPRHLLTEPGMGYRYQP